ncbi:hypothetical protein [Mesobacillus jeotgali]|uniref:hypothetical protein n=1 Tax=Mesobacillus jeotgali TaxID=129985 RepID=UPI0009A5EDC9|nr:hypothetical protein [Mesobacillus jeotgali]
MAIKEDDLYEIKRAGYDRLRPDRAPLFLWGTIVFGGAVLVVALFGVIQADLQVNPLLLTAVRIATIILGAQILLTILFSITPISYALQKMQLIFATIVAFKFSLDTYLFFFVAADTENLPSYIFTTAFILMTSGLVLLIITIIRAFKRVKQGELRKDGEGLYNFKQTKNVLIGPGIFGLVMIAGSLARSISNMEGNIGMYFILFLCITLQYSIAIALPEFILLIYGKFKFESFIVPQRSQHRNKKGKPVRF